MRKLYVWSFFLFFSIMALGCAQESGVPKTLLVGLVDVSEGRFAFFNDSLAVNTRLALGAVSDNGLIRKDGRYVRVQFLTRPMTDTNDAPRQTLYEAVNTHGAQVVIGGARSKTAVGMARAAQELEVPFLATTATAPAVSEGSAFTFPTSPSTDVQARLYAAFLREAPDVKKVALLVEEDTLFAADFADALRRNLLGSGVLISAVRFYGSEDDIVRRLSDIAASEPDAVVMCAIYPHTVVAGAHLKRLGYNGRLLGIHSRQAFVFPEDIVIPSGMPVQYLSYWNPERASPLTRGYVEAFERAVGRTPTEDDAFVYDTMLRLIAAVETADELTSAGLQRALAAMSGMEGVVGSYHFLPESSLDTVWNVTLLDGGAVIEDIHPSASGTRQ